MDRLTPLAAAFLDAEDVDPAASLAIGSFTVFEGPTPDFEEFVRSIEGRLPLIPRYRQKVRNVPFDLAAPAWVDDPDFDVRWHVRNTALPAPGGPEEVGRLMSRVMSRRMDRSRPLWEYWFVEGLPDGQWGIISKLHHCLADGVSGSDLFHLVLDTSPTPRAPVPDTWAPAPPGSTLAFTGAAVRDLLLSPVYGAGLLLKALGAPRRLARSAGAAATGLLVLSGAVRPVHESSLTGPADGSRRYAWTELSLDDVREVRKAFGVTVNDVALAAVTGGFRRLLLSRGERPDAHAVRTLVPVSTREPGTESVTDNQVSLMLPFLPVDEPDPEQRLRQVRRRILELRYGHEPEAGETITTAARIGPFGPVSWAIRTGFRLPQRQVATVTTNVPGPQETLYGLGREVTGMLPYVPIADRVRIGIAMFSYRGTLTFGVTGDYATAPDIDVLADGIAASAAELVDLARRRTAEGRAQT
ncbi:wax ester/triacylglycerol synthase family O-acyltransferase [Nocardioides guangzhouensis]|uniref:Diacylglycerol O-acyltransferase n=1 Tax=Nocardioides guangzhouensis TaxID=2497878 RepID=A0A4Q4Z980_9ACTN|nr:wax ester/triacylglycerol synthase family O-acyltransferase [Nocardioides guangzhouensis]RYP84108.1 wax ester/triacylglycerol synthase family O-acyltransferase [Nocardioides guangzhouensis]